MDKPETVKGYKGFHNDFSCGGGNSDAPLTQYKLGGDYEEDKAQACKKGLHFCEHPLDVFGYYAPADSRFAEVEGSGQISRHDSDTKVACTKLHIGAEISLSGMIQTAVKFVFDRADWSKKENHTDGYRGAASATGTSGAASATGKYSVACGLGVECKARAALNCGIVLVEREWSDSEECWTIKNIKAAKVDGDKIKADTWYALVNGKFTEIG